MFLQPASQSSGAEGYGLRPPRFVYISPAPRFLSETPFLIDAVARLCYYAGGGPFG